MDIYYSTGYGSFGIKEIEDGTEIPSGWTDIAPPLGMLMPVFKNGEWVELEQPEQPEPIEPKLVKTNEELQEENEKLKRAFLELADIVFS